jgi:hypothetical protein
MKGRIRTPAQRQAYQVKRRAEKSAARFAELRRRRAAEDARLLSCAFILAWLNDARPLCPECNLPASTIAVRIDPYLRELQGRDEEVESCRACHERRRCEI